MLENGVVKRAFELARTGAYTSLTGMFPVLKKEGFTESAIEQHLGGRGVRKELRDACKRACQANSAEADKVS